MDLLPLVRVVILNFDGGQMTIDCLTSVTASDWPADRLDIVMVDNGSLDDVVARLPVEFPAVTVIEPLSNTGFAGGCNLGINAPGEWDYVALVNNDATVDPQWIRAMVRSIETSADIGAVCAKVLFEDSYHGVDVELDPSDSPSIVGGDRVGIRLSGLRIDDRRVDHLISFDEGFYPPDRVREDGEEFARWSKLAGSVRVVARDGDTPRSMAMRVASPKRMTMTVHSDSESVITDIGPVAQWVSVSLSGKPFDVINNVGSGLFPGGHGGDIGFLARDRGQFESCSEVFAWCGAAVLMRRRYIDEVGVFDERLFLYYEDTDLSWRGRLAGWKYLYVPEAIVRHRHAASSGEGSPVFRFHTERNRILVNIKLAPARQALRVVRIELGQLVRTVLRDVVGRTVRLHPPVFTNSRHRLRVATSIVRLTPAMLKDRWTMRPKVRRREILRWEMTK